MFFHFNGFPNRQNIIKINYLNIRRINEISATDRIQTRRLLEFYLFCTHMTISSGERNFECQICKNKFGSFEVTCESSYRKKPYECQVCQKRFAYSNDFKVHMRIHSGEKPYECQICNKKFSRSSRLKLHNRIHTGEKPYECRVCQKRFTRSNNLNSHMGTH